MKATEAFAKTIGAYIEKEKQADPLFAKCVDEQPTKTVQGCVNYILKEVKKSGIAGWTDAEIFGMAKHFYDEKELKDPGAISARVVVNHTRPTPLVSASSWTALMRLSTGSADARTRISA